MDRDTIEYDPNPDDERPVPLEEEEPSPPPTLDPEERVEEDEPDDIPLDDERPA
ncbi:MAG: hypothetical protein J0H23_13330 [Micrococcales bacterium]|nr:hypothetical protein [Micrococcales bacterium]